MKLLKTENQKRKKEKKEKKAFAKKKRDKEKNYEEETFQEIDEDLEDVEVKEPTVWDVIAPDGIRIRWEDMGKIKQSLGTMTHFRPFYIPPNGYPRKLQTKWLETLTTSGEMDLMIDIYKDRRNDAIQRFQKRSTMLQSNLLWQQKRGNIDQINEMRTKIEDTEMIMQEIQFKENDSYSVSIIGTLFAEDEKSLNTYSESLEDALKNEGVTLASLFSRVKKGFQSTLPLGKNKIPDSYRNLDRRSLSTFSPFISGSGKFTGGVPIGDNKITGHKEFINSFGNDEFRPQNYNLGVFGIPGSGKSLAMKLILARETSGANVYAAIIDPEGEFKKITKRLHGLNLDIHEESSVIINPCAINYTDLPLDDDEVKEELEHIEQGENNKLLYEKDGKTYVRYVPVREKVSEIIDFFDIIVRGKDGADGGLDVFERNYLEEAIYYIFDEILHINSHPDSLYDEDVAEVNGKIVQSKVRKKEPEIMQVYEYLQENYHNEPKAERIIATIKPFLRTSSKPIFDGQTNLGHGVTQTIESSRVVNFNISEMEEGFLRPVAYHVILNYLWQYFIKNVKNAKKKKKIYCDEIWQFVDSDQTSSFFEKVARRCRKRNAGLVYASQDFVRLLEAKKSRGILTSTFSFIFMQQNKIDLEKIKANFTLSEGELNILFGNPDKGECVYRVGESSVWLQTDPTDEDLLFIESNEAVLEDLIKRKQMTRETNS